MKKRINKILWHGDELEDGFAKAPTVSVSHDGLDGLNEGELFISNNEADPALFIRTSSGKIARIGDSKLFNLVKDEEGNLYIETPYTFVSKRSISALGKGEDFGSEGGGESYDRLDSWDNYVEGDGSVLGADLGYELKGKIDKVDTNTLKLDSEEPQTVKGMVYHEQAYFNNIPFVDIGNQSVQLATKNDVPIIEPLTESGTEIAKITQGGQTTILYAPEGGGASIENVDTSMSDTSENPVQNKVIKSYVDDKIEPLEYTANLNNSLISSQLGMINENKAAINNLELSKAGDFYVEESTGLFIVFISTAAKNAYITSGDTSGVIGSYALGGGGGTSDTKYSMRITNLATSLNFTTASEKMEISANFESMVKYAGSEEYEAFNESAIFSVEVYKAGASSSTVVTNGNIIENGGKFTFDLKPYVGTGANTIVVKAVGLISSASDVKTTTINVTSMSLQPFSFDWYSPFIQGKEYNLGGLKILGALNKNLHIKVTGEGYEKSYEVPIGTTQYNEIAYKFANLEHPASTGIYKVEIWLEAVSNGLTSDVLTYNIMCVTSADASTAQLICLNNIADTLENYSENKMFSYAVYNGGSVTSTPTITVEHDGEVITSGEYTVSAGVENEFIYSFNLSLTETTATILASAVFGNTETIEFTLNNQADYAPVEGYTFCLDAASRSNSDANREKIINTVNGSLILTTWKDMSWVDGMDGWTTDPDGNKCLLIPAMSKAETNIKPMMDISTVSIEMLYRIDNISDFEENAITILKNISEKWMGIRIKPTNITLHSQSMTEDDLRQGYNTDEGKMVHLVVVIAQNYSGIGNLAMLYVNGGKRCSFEWGVGDTFAHDGKLTIGSETADTYFYKMFVYPFALSWPQVMQNYIASKHSMTERAAERRREDEVLDDANELSYDKIYGKYNTFVVELPDGAVLPNKLTNPNNIPIEGTNLYINIVQNPSCSIHGDWLNVPLEGQGTTAMLQLRWNLRSKTSSAYGKFRITSKKNVKSSMHSHKMGATALYNDLNLAIVGDNEAGGRVAVYQYPVYGFLKVKDESNAGAYIYEPIGLYTIGPDKGDKSTFGYDNEEYENTLIHMEGTDHSPRGVGMDYPWEQMVVGVNDDGDAFVGANNGKGGLLQEAWEIGACGDKEEVADMKSYMDEEFAPAYNLDYECTPLLVGLAAGTKIEDVNADLVLFRSQKLDSGFTYGDCIIYIDGAYDTYYYNELTKTYELDGRKVYKGLEAYGFDLSVMASKATMAERTAYVVEYRRLRYRAEMEQYYNLKDNLFHPCFLDIIGATDNEKKNSYPYKFATLASGGRWRWRQDDLDTIFDVNNQGSADKKYSILNTDILGTTMIFKGNTSYHWRCVREYYKDELKSMMQTIFKEMVKRCPAGYGTTTREKLVGCIKYYFWDYAQEYFTNGAYNIDAKWTYEDTWAIYKSNTNVNEVHPLQQSLGSHYEAEVAWVKMRILFLMSMYEFGAFVDYVDTSEGQVEFRQGGAGYTFELTPAVDMRPSVIQGANSTILRAEGRVMAGDKVSIVSGADSSADTIVYIQGADWMQDIGDFSKVQIGSSSSVFKVTSKRLQKLKVGDEVAENVTTNIGGLDIGYCPSMVEVEARNVSNLTGEVNLSQLPRLRRAYFGGTKATVIRLKEGSKIQDFDIPSTIQQLTLRMLPLLDKEGFTYDNLNALTYLWVEDNAKMDGYDLLATALEGGSPLNNIRVIGFYKDGTADDLTFLTALANGNYHGINADGTVNNTSLPTLQGTVNVDGNIYEDDKNILNTYFPNITINALGFYVRFADPEVLRVLLANITTDDGIGLTEEDIEGVTSIGTWFEGNTTIQTFDEFERFIGVSNLSNTFYNCTALLSVKLPNTITAIKGGTYTYSNGVWHNLGAFENCKSLKVIELPSSVTSFANYTFLACLSLEKVVCNSLAALAAAMFSLCSSLREIEFAYPLNTYPSNVFFRCTNFDMVFPLTTNEIGDLAFYASSISGKLNLPNLLSVGNGAFAYCDITEVTSLGNISVMNGGNAYPATGGSFTTGVFHNCTLLEKATLPYTLMSMGQWAFYGCSSLVTLICDAETPPSFGYQALNGTNSALKIYVPDGSITDSEGNTSVIVDNYKAATGWTSYASRIYPRRAYDKITLEIADGSDFVEGYIPITIGHIIGDVRWSIVSGGEYASVDQNGFITINESANNSNIVVRCESVDDPSVYDEVSLVVTYTGKTLLTSIKTTGNQYIITDYMCNPKTEIDFDIMLESNSYTNTAASGNNLFYNTSNSSYVYCVNHGGDASQSTELFFWSNLSYTAGGSVQSIKNCSLNLRTNMGYKYNGSIYQAYYGNGLLNVATPTLTNTNPLILFANQKVDGSVDAIYNRTNAKVYGITIKEDGVVVRSYKPAVRNGVTGLYDEITGKFFSSPNGEQFEYEE